MSEHIHESVLGQGNCELCEARERRLSEALYWLRELYERAGGSWPQVEAVLASQRDISTKQETGP